MANIPPKLGLSKPDRSPTTRFRPEPKVQSVGSGFPFSKTDTGGSSDGFASPKPEQPEPTGATKKSDQILQKQARSGEISTKSREISTRSGYIQWDLARSGQTQQFLAKKKAYFRKNPVFGENFPVFGKNFQFLAKIPDSDDAFSSDFDAFFNSGNRSDPTDANHHRKPNRPIFPVVGFGLLRPST